jgi:hypothetical protein
MGRIHIEVPQKKLESFCKQWDIQELSLFGSVLRDDFKSESDIDVLVTFPPDSGHTLFDLVRMEKELETIFGRHIDLVSRRGVEMSRNHLRRKAIMESAETVYAA